LRSSTQITLTGVSLAGLYLPDYDTTLKMASKRGLAPGTPYACLSRSDFAGGMLWCRRLLKATVAGGRLAPGDLRAQLDMGSVSATGAVLQDKAVHANVVVRGDVTPGHVSAEGNIASLKATGGDLAPGSVRAGGSIATLSARATVYRLSGAATAVGGAVGTCVPALAMADLFTSDTLPLLATSCTPFVSGTDATIRPALRGIGQVSATAGIRGVFVGGATEESGGHVRPTGDARVARLKTMTGDIQGESWSNCPVVFVGEALGFVQY
jgi:hypothetical protein